MLPVETAAGAKTLLGEDAMALKAVPLIDEPSTGGVAATIGIRHAAEEGTFK